MDNNISQEERGRKVSKLIRDNAWNVFQEYAKLGQGSTTLLINAIAFALGDEAPTLATGDVLIPESHTVELVVFTSTKVIYFKGISDKETPALKIFPRSSLTELTVLSAPQVVPSPDFQASGMAQYELQYGAKMQFKLPLNSWANEETRLTIDALLPELISDLNV